MVILLQTSCEHSANKAPWLSFFFSFALIKICSALNYLVLQILGNKRFLVCFSVCTCALDQQCWVEVGDVAASIVWPRCLRWCRSVHTRGWRSDRSWWSDFGDFGKHGQTERVLRSDHQLCSSTTGQNAMKCVNVAVDASQSPPADSIKFNAPLRLSSSTSAWILKSL